MLCGSRHMSSPVLGLFFIQYLCVIVAFREQLVPKAEAGPRASRGVAVSSDKLLDRTLCMF